MSAAISLLVAFLLISKSRSVTLFTGGFCAFLLSYALFSSIFVLIGAAPFIVFFAFYYARACTRSRELLKPGFLASFFILTALLVGPLLWIYLGRGEGFIYWRNVIDLSAFFGGGRWSFGASVAVSFCIYVLCLAIQMPIQSISLVSGLRALRANSLLLGLGLLCAMFFCGLFFISYAGWNNLSTRGSLIPMMVLSFLAARVSRIGSFPMLARWILGALMIFCVFGSVNELGVHYAQAKVVTASTVFEGRFPHSDARKIIYQLNTDRGVHSVSNLDSRVLAAIEADAMLFCEVEKIIENHNHTLITPDLEIIHPTGPIGFWKWQDWKR